jgi:demethylmenaquinone methyltransferase / 2-methoxy-6-polyprenyl-1,4-benzoquinol methylase
MTHSDDTVSFGFENIPAREKQGKVQKLFSNVAYKYDVMNDIMSLGQHRLWKNIFINQLSPRPHKHYLDVAGGTGDIALRIADKIASGKTITILDLTHDMLLEGQKRTNKYNQDIRRICGDAENLPFDDNQFDYYTISYGIRNVTHIDKVLSEAYRVLKSGGKFMCLEFSHVSMPFLKTIYDNYSFHILPKMGQVFANDADSYRYLAESIRRFPKQEHFMTMIQQAGFKHTHYQNLSGGITCIHSGFKAIL